ACHNFTGQGIVCTMANGSGKEERDVKDRRDEIRRRHQERKKNSKISKYNDGKPVIYHEPGEKEDYLSVYQPHSGNKTRMDTQAFTLRQWMILLLMIAVVLFLVVGVLFQNHAPVFDGARTFVKNTFQHEFEFAMVGDWYKEQFGEPLALFPKSDHPD